MPIASVRALLALCAAALLAGPPVVWGQPPPANEDCLACHEDESAERADGRSVAVSPGIFAASVHGALGLACVDCHSDLATIAEFPHPDRLAPPTCSTCHEAAATQYGAGVHAERRETGVRAAACADCHGAHDIRPASDPASRTHHLNVAATCGTCHGPDGATVGVAGAAADVLGHFEDSIHGVALRRTGLVVAPNCASCHAAHETRKQSDPASRTHRTNVVGTCTKCHEGIRPLYERSVHARAVAAGNALAPVCSDCHTAHEIADVAADVWQLGIVRECGTCHEQSLRTYRDTFHGKVTELGFARVAKCADCHRAHDILPASDATSTVSAARRLATCQQCHPGATASFARYDPHADPHDRARNPALYYARVFMKSLLAGVFLFFGIHTLLWFPRSWQARRARGQHQRRPGRVDGDGRPPGGGES